MHSKLPAVLLHLWFVEQLSDAAAHSFTSVSHVTPFQPVAQLHVYELTPSMHVPLFLHGVDAQSSMLF
jgi:hypothetical protein